MESLTDAAYEALDKSLTEEPNSVAVLKFSATWCGPCRVFNPIFQSVADNETFKSVKFAAIDVDSAPNATEAHNVHGVPCVVYLKGGKEVDRSMGVLTETAFIERIEKITKS